MKLPTINYDQLRAEKQRLVDELVACGCAFNTRDESICPFHSERSASLHLHQHDDGGWRFKCFACLASGDWIDARARREGKQREDVCRELGESQTTTKSSAPTRTVTTASSSTPQSRPASQTKPTTYYPTLEALKSAAEFSDKDGGRIKDVFPYTDPETEHIDVYVFRIERADGTKTIRQGHETKQGFVMKAPAAPWPIFNRKRILSAERVVVVEGENKVKCLQKFGIVATTTIGGAGKSSHSNLSPLAGKELVFWSDNDPANQDGKRIGIEHMQEFADLCSKLPKPSKNFWIDVDCLGIGDKEDVVDFVAKMESSGMSFEQQKKTLEDLIADAQPMGAFAELAQLIEDEIHGRRRPLEFPWPTLTYRVRALLPRTITILCGRSGGTKSLFLMNACVHWHEKEIPFAVMMLEDGVLFHLRRAWAISAGDSNITKAEHVEKIGANAMIKLRMSQPFIQGIENSLFAPKATDEVTADYLLDWTRRMIAAGKKIICIDPISLMQADRSPWIEHGKFMRGSKHMLEAKTSDTRMVLVTHPTKGAEGQSLDDIAGGAVFGRAAQAVVWLNAHEPEEGFIQSHCGPTKVSYNRTATCLKGRNSAAERARFAYWFDGEKFRFDEKGELEKD